MHCALINDKKIANLLDVVIYLTYAVHIINLRSFSYCLFEKLYLYIVKKTCMTLFFVLVKNDK